MATEISQTSGAKFDLDRVNEVALLKGTKEACQKAVDMIRALLERAGFVAAAPAPANEREEGGEEGSAAVDAQESNGHGNGNGTGNGSTRAGPRVLPGATPAMVAKMQEQAMSKSAARRKRRKEQQQQEEEEEEDEEEEEQGLDEDGDVVADDDELHGVNDGDEEGGEEDEEEVSAYAAPGTRLLPTEPFALSLSIPQHGYGGGPAPLDGDTTPLQTASPVGVIGRSSFTSSSAAAASPKAFDPAVSPTARDYLDAQGGSDDHFRAPSYEAPAALAALNDAASFSHPPLGMGGFAPGLSPTGLGLAPLIFAAPAPVPVSTLGGAPISPINHSTLPGLLSGGLGGLASPLTSAGLPNPPLKPQPHAEPHLERLQHNSTTEHLLSMILGTAPLPAAGQSALQPDTTPPHVATGSPPMLPVVGLGSTAHPPPLERPTHTNGSQQQRPPPARPQTQPTNSKHFLSKSGFAVRL